MANVATVYSKAFFDFAKQQNVVKEVATDLTDFVQTCEASKELRSFLYHSLIDRENRVELVATLADKMELKEVSKRILSLLAAKNRTAALPEILQAYESLMNQEAGVVKGTITSAVSLSPEVVGSLSAAIQAKLGKEVDLKTVENKELLGGFIVEADGMTFDASLVTQLNRLQDSCNA